MDSRYEMANSDNNLLFTLLLYVSERYFCSVPKKKLLEVNNWSLHFCTFINLNETSSEML